MRAVFARAARYPAAIGSALIAGWDGASASHCGVILPDDSVIDAQIGIGVRSYALADWQAGRQIVRVIDLDLPRPGAAVDYAVAQIGCGYDYRALVGVLLHRDLASHGRHCCTDLLARVIVAGGGTLPDPGMGRWTVASAMLLAHAYRQQ